MVGISVIAAATTASQRACRVKVGMWARAGGVVRAGGIVRACEDVRVRGVRAVACRDVVAGNVAAGALWQVAVATLMLEPANGASRSSVGQQAEAQQ